MFVRTLSARISIKELHEYFSFLSTYKRIRNTKHYLVPYAAVFLYTDFIFKFIIV